MNKEKKGHTLFKKECNSNFSKIPNEIWDIKDKSITSTDKLILIYLHRFSQNWNVYYTSIPKSLGIDKSNFLKRWKLLVERNYLIVTDNSITINYDIMAVSDGQNNGSLRPPINSNDGSLKPANEVVSDHQHGGLKPPSKIVSDHPYKISDKIKPDYDLDNIINEKSKIENEVFIIGNENKTDHSNLPNIDQLVDWNYVIGGKPDRFKKGGNE